MKKGIFIKLNNKYELFSRTQAFVLDYFLKKYLKDGDCVYISIVGKKPTRTEAQNRFYWFYLGLIEDYTGHDSEYLHEMFKNKLLSPEYRTIMGESVAKYPSTTELSITEFMDYVRNIELFFPEVPLPDTEVFGLNEYMKKANIVL